MLYCCSYVTIAMSQENAAGDECESLAANIRAARQAMVPDMVVRTVRTVGDVDLSLLHLATLFVLADDQALTVKELAQRIGRSVSVTSRTLDQLVSQRLASRREDKRDRRAKRVRITNAGRAFLDALHHDRADAQLALMAYLSRDEQALVARAMGLLATAAQRRRLDGYEEPPRAAAASD